MRLPVKKNCCRKALLLGLLLSARPHGDGAVLYMYQREVAELTATLLRGVFHAECHREERVYAGRRAVVLTFQCPTAEHFLKKLDEDPSVTVRDAAGFRCDLCDRHFLRGVFLGSATVTDPQKGYHMEISLPTLGRADAVASDLAVTVGKAGRTHRGERFGICYKSNGRISDLLYWIGCPKTGFEVTNASIEKEIRNNENRATNCVARNIARSVGAAQKQRAAIEQLIRTHAIDALPCELQKTASLRMEYADASLTELALLHEPPLTKSGLNRRLQRLMELAEEGQTEEIPAEESLTKESEAKASPAEKSPTKENSAKKKSAAEAGEDDHVPV